MSEAASSAVQVVDRPEESRFDALLDGAVAGFAAYELSGDDRIVFTHTKVDPDFEGRGVGSALAKAALDDARARGLVVVPLCPFIAGWIRRHPAYADLTGPR